MGSRGNRTNVASGTKVLEPLCLNPSTPASRTDDAVELLNALKQFTLKTSDVTRMQVPTCYPPQTELPPNHVAPLVTRLDAFLTFTRQHQIEKEDILWGQKKGFVHGEPLTVRSDAERVNYLLLLWYFLKGNSHVYKEINMINMDHVHPTLVHRIIAAQQNEPECGYVAYCKDTGSCFTADLHVGEGK